jgi:hypothetical protein
MDTSTLHGGGQSDIYPASITFPALNLNDLQMERVIGCQLQWPGLKDSDVLMLLGRDLLKHFLLVYNGVHSDVTLSL